MKTDCTPFTYSIINAEYVGLSLWILNVNNVIDWMNNSQINKSFFFIKNVLRRDL